MHAFFVTQTRYLVGKSIPFIHSFRAKNRCLVGIMQNGEVGTRIRKVPICNAAPGLNTHFLRLFPMHIFLHVDVVRDL